MHYIRFLKAPRVDPTLSSKDRLSVVTKVAITSDLGEAFLAADLPLIVEVESSPSASGVVRVPKQHGKAPARPREVQWKGGAGMRALDIRIELSSEEKAFHAGGNVRLYVRARDAKLDAEDLIEHSRGPSSSSGSQRENKGKVLAVRSMDFNLDPKLLERAQTSAGPKLSERRLIAEGQELHIWEELGESIARHIWYACFDWYHFRDAGLVLSAYLASTSPMKRKRKRGKSDSNVAPVTQRMKTLEAIMGKEGLSILELGAGCGIVGIALATYFPNAASVTLTDLPEAAEILEHNLSVATSKSSSLASKLSAQDFDWSTSLPENMHSKTWDLIIVADCTYNPDVVPDLVNTLNTIALSNPDVLALLAMKVRHESEMVFFDLMKESGFEIKENIGIPLPLLGLDVEEMIEIYMFGVSGS